MFIDGEDQKCDCCDEFKERAVMEVITAYENPTKSKEIG